jgi:predicted nucleotidyltransferase
MKLTVAEGASFMNAKDFIPEMTDRIVNKFHPLRIILFGSQARGDTDRESDVDLLIVLQGYNNRRQKSIEIRRSLSDLPICKDIFVTTPEEINQRGHLVGDVLRSALREGKVIYEQS